MLKITRALAAYLIKQHGGISLHLLTPKRHENGNFHLINILAD